MKLLIAIPSPELVDAEFALKNLPLIIAYTKEHLPTLELKLEFKTGTRTDSNRNFLIKEALDKDMDYIMFLDADELYPPNIIEMLIKANKDIIGTCYYKRTPPYTPVVYVDNNKENKDTLPYTPIDLPFIPKGQILEVSGCGFGGMLVRTDVFKMMGDDKWTVYGKNFHIPEEIPDKLSHDLNFCETAKKYGYKIYVHTSVIAGHIARHVVTERNFMEELHKTKLPNIVVLIPSINKEKAKITVNQLASRAGVEAKYIVLDDKERKGYVEMINKGLLMYKDADFIVYTAEDAFGGVNWLLNAWETMEDKYAGLLAFNDGKWEGRIASFGMIRTEWLRYIYDGKFLMHPSYKSHYGDTELSIIAMSQGKLIYNPNCILVEVDSNKKEHIVNEEDRAKFIERKMNGFDKRVLNEKYLDLFEASTNKELKQGIIIVTHEKVRKYFDNLVKSLKGCKYPIHIVVNETSKKPYYTEKIKKQFESVIEFEGNHYELSAFEANKKLKLDEFLLLPATTEIVDQSVLDMVFNNLKGRSVAFSTYPTAFGMFIGKYRKLVLDKMEFLMPENKAEAVEMEMVFNNQYVQIDPNTIVLWKDFVDNDNIVEKFGEKRMLIENKFIKKWKGTWSRNMAE